MRTERLTDDRAFVHLTMQDGDVHAHGPATVIAAPPSVVTESNCEERHGLSRKALRRCFRAGLVSFQTPDGRACALADLVAFLREHGDVMPAATGGARQANDNTVVPDDAALLAQGGVRLRSVGGGRR